MQSFRFFYKALLCCSLFSATAQAAVSDAQLVGTVQGSFAVSPSGSATYEIPIKLPPTVGGIQPQISLNYDSSVGNGLLGMGWSLAGLSSISRCATNLEQDGHIDAVDFDDNDQFCLDGQRLISVGGNEYRTTLDNFSQITGGENGFTVITPTGLIKHYGKQFNNQVYPQGRSSTVVTWLLHRVEDSFGNYYTIDYQNNSLNKGEYYVTAFQMYANQILLSQVNLEYEGRLDTISGHQAGSEYKLSKRLSAIKTYTKNSLTKQYLIDYADAITPLNISNVDSIAECDPNSNCLSPINLRWNEYVAPDFSAPELAIAASSANGLNPFSYNGRHESYVDLNGDGLLDKVWVPSGRYDLWVALSTGTGFESPYIALHASSANGRHPYSNSGMHEGYVDVNGDGLVDRVWVPDGLNDVYVAFSDGTRFGTPQLALQANSAGGSPVFSYQGSHESYEDINGDGRVDKVWVPNGRHDLWVALSTGTGFETPKIWLATSAAGGKHPYSYGGRHESYVDLNGDGLPDKVWVPSGRYDLWVALSTGTGFESPYIALHAGSANGRHPYSNAGMHEGYVDVNGDGLVDRVWVPDGLNDVYVAFSDGTRFGTPQLALQANSAGGSPVFSYQGSHESYADINGDGRVDKVWVPNGRHDLWVALSTGTGFDTPKMWLAAGAAGGKHPYSYGGRHESYVDLNGDNLPDKVWVPSGVNDLYVSYSEASNNVVQEIFTELASVVKFQYNYLTQSSIYKKNDLSVTKNQNANFPADYQPIHQITPPSYVVSEVTQPDGIGGTKSTSYRYEGLRFDRYAKRNLGFANMIEEDNQSGIRNETSFNQHYPFIGMVASQKQSLISSGQLLSRTDNSGFGKKDTSGKKTYFPFVGKQTSTQYLLNDQLYKVATNKTTSESIFDAAGQLSQKTVTQSGSDGLGDFVVTTQNTYTNHYSNRRQGEITRTSLTSSAPNQLPIKRTSEYDYDWSTGRLIKEVLEPGNSDESITRVSVYDYDRFGNRISAVTCDGRFVYSCSKNAQGARFSTTEYSSDGLFPIKSTNALNQSTLRSYDARFGRVTRVTDINGLKTQTQYDDLGREISITNPYQQVTTINRAWSDASCPTVSGQQAFSKVTTTTANKPTKVVYFDQFQREIRRQTQGFGSETILIDTEYDAFGRVKRSSEPYFSGDSVYWTRSEYDELGRKQTIYSPNQNGISQQASTISYQGFTTVTTDALGRRIQEVKNAMGKVVQMTDKAQNNTYYEYDSAGNLLKTTDSAGNVVELEYDLRGRKTTLIDPDMGTWRYAYNVFDQLVEQRDAKNQVTKMRYDVLSRMTSRTHAHGTTQAKTASWVYYQSPQKSAGKLYQKTSANGDYTRYFYNNSYGQLVQTDQKIATKLFSIKQSYDSIGRVQEINYPSTKGYSSGFKVHRDYNAKGFLERVRAPDNSMIFWQAESMSPRGQLEAVSYGNGVQELTAHSLANGWVVASQVYKGTQDLSDISYRFDDVGNLIQREDVLQQTMRETFIYDELDRLSYSEIDSGPSGLYHPDMAFSYDNLGNILSKSDVGIYSYQGCGGRPHAICRAGGTNYSYDANGNMVSAVNGSIITNVAYTAFNKANHLQKGLYAVTFNYDADLMRNYKSRVQNGSLNLQSYYVGVAGQGAKLFEQEVSSAHGVKDIHYIYGSGAQAVATHITEGSQKRTEYLHRDHLGSLTITTNSTGQKVSNTSFDPWGNRRNPNWTASVNPQTLPEIIGNIGFTGQEHIPSIGLVHMNGRIYDPKLGRFLSADPLIQAPYNSQSYNRYSYVMNNPLSLVDPTGYSWVSKKWKSAKKFIKKHKSTIKFIATSYFVGFNTAVATNKSVRRYVRTHKWSQQVLSAAAGIADGIGCAGACSAGMSAYLTDLSGGNFGDMLKAAGMSYLSSAAFNGINASYGNTWNLSRVAANAAVGGTLSTLSGGKFIDGLKFSGGVSLSQYSFNKLTLAGEEAGYVPRLGGTNVGDNPFAQSAPLITSLKGDLVTLKYSRGLELMNYKQFAFGFADGVGTGSEYWFSQQRLSSYNVPFLHEISLAHDIGLGFLGHGNVANISSMPVAAGMVLGGYAGLNQASFYADQYARKGRFSI